MTAGIKANADGSAAIQVGGSDAITITSALNTTFAGTANVATGALYPIVSGTAQTTTSGTSKDFTGIPSWVKRITVMFSGVSISGTSAPMIQIGSGSVTTSGYVASASVSTSTTANSSTAGFIASFGGGGATFTVSGSIVLTLISNNTWVASGTLANTVTFIFTTSSGGVSPNLSGALDRVRVTTVNGTDTFDAGSVNILYE